MKKHSILQIYGLILTTFQFQHIFEKEQLHNIHLFTLFLNSDQSNQFNHIRKDIKKHLQ